MAAADDRLEVTGGDVVVGADRSIDGSTGGTTYGGVGSWRVSARCGADLSIIGEVTRCHVPVQRSRTAYLLLRFGAGPVDSRTTKVVFTLCCSP